MKTSYTSLVRKCVTHHSRAAEYTTEQSCLAKLLLICAIHTINILYTVYYTIYYTVYTHDCSGVVTHTIHTIIIINIYHILIL